MNYQLFSGFSPLQVSTSKALISSIIDQNYKHTVLDSVRQAEYDNLKEIVTALNLATAHRQPALLNIA